MPRPHAFHSFGSITLALLLAAVVGACAVDEDITGPAETDEPARSVAPGTALMLSPAPFIDASLRNGDLGGGVTNVPPAGGLVDTPDGVEFVANAPNNRSHGIVTWNIPSRGVNGADLRRSGTVSFMIYVDSDDYVPGELVAENYGFGRFNNGQGTFGLATLPIGPGGVGIHSAAWLSGFWDRHNTPEAFPADSWHSVGFTWGGADSDYEVCVDGVVVNAYDTPPGRSLPWGLSFSAEQLGLGYHHERGRGPARSVVGVVVADFRVWTDPVPACGTEPVAPANAPPEAVDDAAESTPRTAVDVDVLANDTDPDGDPLEVVAVTQSTTTGALVSINADGTVRYAPVDVGRVASRVQGLSGLNQGQIRSLLAKLDAAERSFERGRDNAAAGQLGAFVNEVAAFERTGKLDPATAAELVALVEELLDPPGTDAFTYTISDGELTDDATVTIVIQP